MSKFKYDEALKIALGFDNKPDYIATLPSAALYAALELRWYQWYDNKWQQVTGIANLDLYQAERRLLLWYVAGIPCGRSDYGTVISGRKLLPNPKGVAYE